MTPETILNAAIGVLERQGRCKHTFGRTDGPVDQSGALALAAGYAPNAWKVIRHLDYEDLTPGRRALVDAARFLAEAEAPLQPVREMPLHALVMLLGDSNDIATDEQVYESLAKAAALAERAGVLR